MSALKFPRTRSSDRSLDMHHSYVELEHHRGLCVGSDRFPPAVCIAAMARAGGNGISNGHFSHTGGGRVCLSHQKITVTKQLHCFHQEWQKSSVCKISAVLLKLRPRSAKYKGHLKQRMEWWLRSQAGTKGGWTQTGSSHLGVSVVHTDFCSFPHVQSPRDS